MAMTKEFKKLPKAAKKAAFAHMDEDSVGKRLSRSSKRATVPIDIAVRSQIINTNLAGFKKVPKNNRSDAIKMIEKVSKGFSDIDKDLGMSEYANKVKSLGRVVSRAKKIK